MAEPSPPRIRAGTPALVLLAGGTFIMGHDDIVEAEAPNPPHDVEVAPFWLGVHPVTNGEYGVFLADVGAPPHPPTGSPRFDDPSCPVVNVCWDDARRYCAWAGGTLPTEAEWERAARGDDRRRYPWGDEPPSAHLACFAEDWNRGGPSRVGDHPEGRGPFGCHDLAGNVWEWCLDVFERDAHLQRPSLGKSACVSGASRLRPLRGGCWRSIDCKLQASYRNWGHEVSRHTTIGFRLCVPG